MNSKRILLSTSILFQLLLASPIIAQTANANIRLWLKADAGTNTTANGGGITSWTDQGGAGNNPTVTIPSGTITYNNTSTYGSANFFNYNPSITFNGGYLQFPDAFASGMNGSAASMFYMFSILNTTPTTTISTMGELHNFSVGSGVIYCPFPHNTGSVIQYVDDFGTTATGLFPFLSANDYNRVGTGTYYNSVTNMALPVLYNTANEGSGASWLSKTYLNAATQRNVAETDAPSYKLNATTGPVTIFKGDNGSTIPLRNTVSEILLFNTNLPANEKSNVDSYLAIKNGVTLLQTAATNYTASASTTTKWANDATIIWNAATNGTYKNNIIGIGKDNLTTSILHQRQSRSVNTASNGNAIAISTQTIAGTNAANTTNIAGGNRYFMVADNGGSMTASNPTASQVPAGVVTHITRQWRVQATNFSQNVTIAFDISQLSGSVTPSDLRLLIDGTDNDGNFTNGTIWSGPGGMAPQQNATFPNLYEFRDITMAQLGSTNFLFTLASASWTTPLPLELIDFNGTCDGEQVELGWTTQSEHNFDRFEVERSPNGTDFEEIATIQGHENSQTLNEYRMADVSTGTAYYRLKQIDKNGAISFSNIITVNCLDQNGLFFYPNPLKSGEELSWWTNETFKHDVTMQLLDVSGKVIGTETLEAGFSQGVITTGVPAKGMYFIQLDAPGKQPQTVKLIVD